VESQQLERLAASPGDLVTAINSDLPEEVRYLALLTVAQVYLDRNEPARARAALNQAVARPPDDASALATAHFLLGYAYQMEPAADLLRAVRAYGDALAVRPDLISAYNNRAAAYLAIGGAENAARAIDDLDRAIEMQPGQVAAYFNRGIAYIRLDNRQGWESNLAETLALQPDHVGALNALCWAYALEDEPATALSYCDRAVALDPEGPARDSRAIVYAQSGRYAEAAAEFGAYLAALQARDPAEYQRGEPRYREWLGALAADRNPFDPATLARLREE
jgi:tetratricopeptide (TPR) repeat protein